MTASHHCRGAPSSRHFLLFRSYAPAHMCAEKNARARARINTHAYTHTHTHTYNRKERRPRDPARAVFYPSSQFPSRNTVVFWGVGRAGVSERKGKGIWRGQEAGGERRRRREKGRGCKEREKRGRCVGWHFYWSLGIRCPHHRRH